MIYLTVNSFLDKNDDPIFMSNHKCSINYTLCEQKLNVFFISRNKFGKQLLVNVFSINC